MKGILEWLKHEFPAGAGRKNNRQVLARVQDWVRDHSDEIREAFERGYSWKQISRACVKESELFYHVYMWKDDSLIEYMYHKVRASQSESSRRVTEELTVRRKLSAVPVR